MRPLGFTAVLYGCLAAAFGQPASDSLAHYNKAETFFQQYDYQDAANEFRAALNGDLNPKWIEVWSHIYLGRIFETVGQHDRAMNEFKLAIATADDTRGAQDMAQAALRRKEPVDLLPLPGIVYSAGGDVLGPILKGQNAPEYSVEARRAGLEGTVYLSGVVGEDGFARDLHVTRSLGLGLDERAIEAVN